MADAEAVAASVASHVESGTLASSLTSSSTTGAVFEVPKAVDERQVQYGDMVGPTQDQSPDRVSS